MESTQESGSRKRQTGGGRAPGGSAVFRPPVLSAVCERRLSSRLFSPHSTARPTTEYALDPSEFRRHLPLLLASALPLDARGGCGTPRTRVARAVSGNMRLRARQLRRQGAHNPSGRMLCRQRRVLLREWRTPTLRSRTPSTRYDLSCRSPSPSSHRTCQHAAHAPRLAPPRTRVLECVARPTACPCQ